MFANDKYGFIAWMQNCVNLDQLAPIGLDLHCFQERLYNVEKYILSLNFVAFGTFALQEFQSCVETGAV